VKRWVYARHLPLSEGQVNGGKKTAKVTMPGAPVTAALDRAIGADECAEDAGSVMEATRNLMLVREVGKSPCRLAGPRMGSPSQSYTTRRWSK